MRGTETPNIIDITASGSSTASYPIEVGVVLSNSHRYCRIIKPVSCWTEWSSIVEAEHGISRDSLCLDGQEVTVIAVQLNELLAGKTIHSVNCAAGQLWLNKLFLYAEVEMAFNLLPLETIVNEAQLKCWEQIKQKLRNDHHMLRDRATNNAWITQRCFVMSKKIAQTVYVSRDTAFKKVG